MLILRTERTPKPLNRNDIAIISTVNHYASTFDIRGIRIVLKDNVTLFLREDALEYLHSDAKIFLESMGAIPRNGQQ